MNTTATHLAARLPRPRKSTVVWGLAILNVQALFVLTYVAVTGRPLLDPFVFYPFVWINVGLWAIVRTDPPASTQRRRRIAAAVAVGYFGVLALAGNMLGPGELLGGNPALGLEVVLYRVPPGWAPSVIYNGSLVHVSLIPPYVVGFLALTYLVYATVLDVASLASVGLVGVFSCLTCTLPLVAAVVTGVAGGSSAALLAFVAPIAYPLGTALFVVTVGLLYWRPGFGRLS